MSVGEWVRAVRRALGVRSQEAFAERLGFGRSAVAKWESEIQTPNLESFRKLWRIATPELRASAPQAIESLGLSDLDRTLPNELTKGENYTVKTDQGRILAKLIDGIEDDAERTRAMNRCLNALDSQSPSELGADNRSDRAQRR